MKSFMRSMCVPGLTLLLVASRASAQQPPARVEILTVPIGARPVGLGGAAVTTDGPDAFYQNPSQVGSSHGAEIGVERVGGATLGVLTTTGNAGAYGIGASVRFLRRDDDVVGGSNDHVGGGGLTAGVGVARQLKGVWVGATANFVAPDLSTSGATVTFDVGLSVRRFGLLFGASLQNIGSDFPAGTTRLAEVIVVPVTRKLPLRGSVGASLPSRPISTFFDFGASAEVSYERNGEVVPRAGVELTYEPLQGWTFTGRVGAHRPIVRDDMIHESPISLGASMGIQSFSIDYAFQPAVASGQALHLLGIRIQ